MKNPKDETQVREAQAVERYVVETVEEKALRVRPPGAVDEFIEDWTMREDVRAILEAWAKSQSEPCLRRQPSKEAE